MKWEDYDKQGREMIVDMIISWLLPICAYARIPMELTEKLKPRLHITFARINPYQYQFQVYGAVLFAWYWNAWDEPRRSLNCAKFWVKMSDNLFSREEYLAKQLDILALVASDAFDECPRILT